MNVDSLNREHTIVALATAHGSAAIAVVRLSGKEAILICDKVFFSKSLKPKKLSGQKPNTIHFGVIRDGNTTIDEVLVSIFKNPHSYTGEDVVEISCHGSLYIQQQIIQLLVKHGATMARAGEFTFRAFLNGKMDLSQSEAVADIISSNSPSSHQVAIQQMRGGFSDKIKTLRDNLINFASLIELELDFSEEDVEFANRSDLKKLVMVIRKIVERLITSFEVGNVIKNGIPVSIIGKPNVGKSTLLNTLLNEDKAIVSDLPGTTRDAIEDEMIIDGVLFRFIDTAGMRSTNDTIESIGISKTFEKIKQSSIIVYLFDTHEMSSKDLARSIDEVKEHLNGSPLLIVGNKVDKEDIVYLKREFSDFRDIVFISAKEKQNIEGLKKRLVDMFDSKTVNLTETIVTNARHVEALENTNKSLLKILEGLNNNISGELLSVDIRKALHHLGEITGEVTTDDLLKNIFSKFCIGK